MAQTDRFDLNIVLSHFETSLQDSPDDIKSDPYLLGYRELNKFFQLMGTVFGFVSSDVSSKIEILEEFRRVDGSAQKFTSFKSMIEHEKSTGLLSKNDYVSASRTLLRLHRGLDFIREFLRALGDLNGNDKTSQCCQAAYNQTLAQFHPWLVRKGAVMAMYTMPTRDQLLNRVCLNVTEAIDSLPAMLLVTKQVYERTHELYSVYDMHGLP